MLWPTENGGSGTTNASDPAEKSDERPTNEPKPKKPSAKTAYGKRRRYSGQHSLTAQEKNKLELFAERAKAAARERGIYKHKD